MASSQVEVLPKITDRVKAFATLDSVQGQLRRAATVYEQLIAFIEDGSSVVMPVVEVTCMLIGQAEPMREALSALLPYIDDMRDGLGRIGPVRQGIYEALDAVDIEPTSVSIVKAFGFVCAVCCAMERSLADLHSARNAPPVRFDADSNQELVMDQHLVDALGYLLHAHWDEVKPYAQQRPAIGRASRLYIRHLHNPTEPLDRMDIEVLSSVGLWAILVWADLALRTPTYVDSVKRFQCIMPAFLP